MFKMMLLMFAIMISTCYGSNDKAYRQESMIYQPDDFETELSYIPYPHIEEKLSSLAVAETFLSEYLPYTEIEDSMINQPSTIFNTNVKQLSKLKMQWRPRTLHYENDSIQILTRDGQLKKEYSQMKIQFVDSKRIMIFNAGEKTIKFQNQKDYTMWKNEFEKNATKENMIWFEKFSQEDKYKIVQLLTRAIQHYGKMNENVVKDMKDAFKIHGAQTHQLYEILNLRKLEKEVELNLKNAQFQRKCIDSRLKEKEQQYRYEEEIEICEKENMIWFEKFSQEDKYKIVQLLTRAIQHYGKMNENVVKDMKDAFKIHGAQTHQLYEILNLRKACRR